MGCADRRARTLSAEANLREQVMPEPKAPKPRSTAASVEYSAMTRNPRHGDGNCDEMNGGESVAETIDMLLRGRYRISSRCRLR